MKLGIIASAGGSAFGEMAAIVGQGVEFVVITDRECGAEQWAARLGFDCVRIEDKDRRSFSTSAACSLRDRGVTSALLYFSRLVSLELYEALPTFNVHPALLPAFPGLDPIGQAKRAGVKVLGATLHAVDETVDGGSIVAQIATPISADDDWHKISFLQKVYLGLVWVEKMTGYAAWQYGFAALQQRERTHILP